MKSYVDIYREQWNLVTEVLGIACRYRTVKKKCKTTSNKNESAKKGCKTAGGQQRHGELHNAKCKNDIQEKDTRARTCTGRVGQQSLQSLGVYYLPVGRDLFGRL